MTRLMSTLLPLLLLLILAVGAIALLQRRFIYFPFRDVPSPDAVGLQQVENVTFRTTDGVTLNGWFLPAPQTPPPFSVIVFNGNAGNRAYRAPLAAALRRNGMAVLLFDYRGFGENGGIPGESGLALDARAARDYLRQRPDVDANRLAYLGESLGAAVAIELATEHPPAALILRSPFTSMMDVGRLHYPFLPVSLLLRDRYASIDRINRVRSPLLVVAGGLDSIVPADQSQRLYDVAPQPKTLLVIPDADHNDEALLAGREMIDTILGFLGEIDTAGLKPGTTGETSKPHVH
jgi:fermentation-respiration switch protein FrsA (DUF1100 family)